MLTATDGDLKDSADLFRIKIWDKSTGLIIMWVIAGLMSRNTQKL